jgi:hypothetical protein
MVHSKFSSLSESCWFCLASAAVEKHLVISIGSEVGSFIVNGVAPISLKEDAAVLYHTFMGKRGSFRILFAVT